MARLSGLTAQGGASRANGQSWSVTQLNSHLTSGGKVSIHSGGNTTLAGAVVQGDKIAVQVDGNLLLQSRQDTSHSSNSSANLSGSATLGLVGPSSGSFSAGGSRGTSDTAWVVEQTGLYGKTEVNVYVQKHTQLDGAVMNAANGNLKLDTGTLGFSTIVDHDTGTSMSGQVGLTTPGAPGERPGITASGAYAAHDKEQETRATLGPGEIIIRDKDKQKQDVATLNRDVEKAQVITKDVKAGVQVYGSSNAVQTIAQIAKSVTPAINNLVENLFQKDNLSKTQINQMTDVVAGRLSGDLTDDLIRSSCRQGYLRPGILEWFIPSAYAAGGDCVVPGKSGTVYVVPRGKADDCITAAVNAERNPDVQDRIITASYQGTCAQYISANCQGRVLRVFPGQFLGKSVQDVLDAAKAGDRDAQTAKKLLFDNRFQK